MALSVTTTTGTIAPNNSRDFEVPIGSTLVLTFPPNSQATVTENPLFVGETTTAGKLDQRITRIDSIPQTVTCGPYPTGANVTVAVSSRSSATASWSESSPEILGGPRINGTFSHDLASALVANAGKNAYDTYGQTASKVSSVTLGATVFSGGVVKNVFDAGAYDYLRIYGAVYRAGFTGYTDLVVTNSSGYPVWLNPTGPGTTAENQRGQHLRVRFKAKQFQIKVRGYGLNSDYVPMWLDDGSGFKRISFTSGAVASDSYIQIDLTKYGEYELAVHMEQSVSVGAVVLDADGEFVSVAPATPLVVFGDSYVQGTTSPTVTGSDPVLCGAMAHISGLNVIPLGVGSTGYVASSYPITHAERLALMTSVINTSGAPVAMSVFGTNDVGQTTAAVQAAATTTINHLLSTTGANILLTGAQPRSLDNSAAIQLVDAGIAAAVAAANSPRVAYAPIGGATPRRITGTKDIDTSTGTAGNSRWIHGNDGIHLSASFTQAGTEFYARYMLELLQDAAIAKGW